MDTAVSWREGQVRDWAPWYILVGRTRAGIGHCNVLEAGPEPRLGTSVLVGGARAGIGHCSALEAGSRSRLAPYCLGGQGQRTRLDTSVPWGAVPRLLGNPLRRLSSPKVWLGGVEDRQGLIL